MVSGKLQEYTFEITHEEVVKKRYLTLYNRRIRFPAHADKPVNALPPTAAGHYLHSTLLLGQRQPPWSWQMYPHAHDSLRFMSISSTAWTYGLHTDLPRSGHSRAAILFQLLMCIGMTET